MYMNACNPRSIDKITLNFIIEKLIGGNVS